MGYAGGEVPKKQAEVFGVVKGARDAVVERLRDAWQAGEALEGWQLDRVAREHIWGAGYGDFFIHHSSNRPQHWPRGNVHALGVNLDDFETHDSRTVLPGVGFTIEPGIYLPELGVSL